MNENLIFEGNTIYELDPVCLNQKMSGDKGTDRKKERSVRKMRQFSLNDRDAVTSLWMAIVFCCFFRGKRSGRNHSQ